MLQKSSVLFNFSPFPKLETERLTLRALTLEDEEPLYRLRSDDRVLEFIQITKAKDKIDSRNFIKNIMGLVEKNESVMWAITLKGQDELIGTICFWNISSDGNEAEIGYMLSPEYQGKGIMRESVVEVIDYGFTAMKLRKIIAVLHPENIKSTKLLEKEGFVYDKIEEGEGLLYTGESNYRLRLILCHVLRKVDTIYYVFMLLHGPWLVFQDLRTNAAVVHCMLGCLVLLLVRLAFHL